MFCPSCQIRSSALEGDSISLLIKISNPKVRERVHGPRLWRSPAAAHRNETESGNHIESEFRPIRKLGRTAAVAKPSRSTQKSTGFGNIQKACGYRQRCDWASPQWRSVKDTIAHKRLGTFCCSRANPWDQAPALPLLDYSRYSVRLSTRVRRRACMCQNN